jgi:hypothetical protein
MQRNDPSRMHILPSSHSPQVSRRPGIRKGGQKLSNLLHDVTDSYASSAFRASILAEEIRTLQLAHLHRRLILDQLGQALSASAAMVAAAHVNLPVPGTKSSYK